MNQVVVSTKQRFRLRIFILGKGISIASRYLISKIKDIVVTKSQDQKEWREIVEIEQDFNTLSRESLQSFRTLLEVLSGEDARRLSQDCASRLPQPTKQITSPSSLYPKKLYALVFPPRH
jgi:hypothetical protein